MGADDTYKVAEVVAECELVHGVWAKPQATVVWYSNGQIERLTATGRDSTVAPGIVVEPDAYLSWHPNGQVAYVQVLKSDAEVAPGIWARRGGSFVSWRENGSVEWVEILMKDFSNAKKCQTVLFNSDGTVASAKNSYMWPKCD